ncbi:MAG: hypothetical protein AB7F61_12320 [Desulfobulbus sp.]
MFLIGFPRESVLNLLVAPGVFVIVRLEPVRKRKPIPIVACRVAIGGGKICPFFCGAGGRGVENGWNIEGLVTKETTGKQASQKQ